jgi:HlyD family secretion protein
MQAGFFRRAALDKISSPEQLDLPMQVLSPTGWVALAASGLVLLVTFAWSLFGSIPDLVEGQGMLLRGERLTEVRAGVSGTLARLELAPDAEVRTGQLIAVVNRDRSELEQKIVLKQEQLNRLRAEHAAENSNDQMVMGRNEALRAAKRHELSSLGRQRVTLEDLVNRGLKPGNALFELERKINAVHGEIGALEKENAVARNRMAARLTREADVAAEIEYLKGELQRTATEIRSPQSGRVVEVLKTPGDKVREDEPLVRIETSPSPREGAPAERGFCQGAVHAVIYVPGRFAGKLKASQPARVSPADVKREEHGYIVGMLEWVSTYAASPDDMREKLKNDRLVQSYTEEGPVFETRVCLLADPSNPANGFKWSSSTGPRKKIGSGSLATASLVVGYRRPYTYVIPTVRSVLGV